MEGMKFKFKVLSWDEKMYIYLCMSRIFSDCGKAWLEKKKASTKGSLILPISRIPLVITTGKARHMENFKSNRKPLLTLEVLRRK
jgi:hypothetical protein